MLHRQEIKFKVKKEEGGIRHKIFYQDGFRIRLLICNLIETRSDY